MISRANGNPFFLSELTRLELSDDSSDSTTPAVRDVVMRRVDALGNDARRVLTTAALIGPKPNVGLLAAVVGDATSCDAVLDDAERANLLELDGFVLRWSHDLVRDALVESTRSQESRRIHARIAAALRAESFPDSLQIAHHLLASAQAVRIAVSLENGELDDAARWIPVLNAGVLRIGLPPAMGFYTTAALIHLLQGRFDEAEESAAQNVAMAPAAGLSEALGVQASHFGFTAILRGEFAEFMAGANFFLQNAAGTRDSLLVLGFVALGAALMGDRESAESSIEEVFRIGIEELDFAFGQGAVIALLLAEAGCVLGDRASVAEFEQLLEPYAGRMPIGGMAPALAFRAADHVLAMCAHLRGDLSVARARIDAAIAFHTHMGGGPFVARSRLVSAQIAAGEGDVPRAVADGKRRPPRRWVTTRGSRGYAITTQQSASSWPSMAAAR